MTGFFTPRLLRNTLTTFAWLCWVLGAFYFAMPYFYVVFGDTRLGAMAIVASAFVGAFFGVIGFVFFLLSRYAARENLSTPAKAVLWSIAGATIYALAMLAIWFVVEQLAKWARSG